VGQKLLSTGVETWGFMMVEVMVETILVFLYFAFTLLLVPYGYNCFYMVYFSRKYRAPEFVGVKNHAFVTVQLPIYNEKYVVERLIDSVCEMDWPRDKLEVMILDDSTDETRGIIDVKIEEYRRAGIDIRAVRRDNRVGYKAGALQNAYAITRGKYIAIIDADFVPPPDFLERTVAAIETDPKLGFVQARWTHINRGYSAYTEAFGIAIDGYHIVEQSARSTTGLLLNFNGSAGLLRVDAIRDVGGWSWDTLSEDMDLSYQMQLKGWKSLYLRDLTVQGEIPANMASFRTQQGRWARGSVQCAKKLLGSVWRAPITLLQKVESTLHLTYYMVSLWMFLSLLVAVPLLALNKFPYVTSPIFVGLLSVCTISSFLLYYFALRGQGMSVVKKIPYIGFLAVIGYGISAKVSVEMLKGLIWKGGQYQRVPKFNIIKPGDRLGQSYTTFKELPWLEMAMLVYTSLGIMFAFMNDSWGIMLYLFLYFAGYFTLAYSISPL
jgi:cellulose synthase/poly-beta-1,6-N-acetylglucosamine synthase-like glycosyltransferase